MYKTIFSKIFYEDVNRCHKYVKEKPYSRALVQNKYLAFLGLRSIKVKNYLLFYKIIENIVWRKVY